MGTRLLLFSLLVASLSLFGSEEPGFVPLFNGRNLEGWILVNKTGPGYIVQNGILVCPEDGGGNLFTEKEYANFVLRFEFRLREGSNNGVGIRAPLEGRISFAGMEIQILDDTASKYQGRLKPAQFHGSIYDVIPARQGFLRKTGEWNAEEITANGRRIAVKLNGTVILDADLDTVKDPAVLQRHPGLSRTRGHVGFLGHRSHVEFRNIRIRELAE